MRLWNILVPYLGETGTYLGVSARNIPQNVLRRPLIFSRLRENKSRAENPRVGGSIPPLATIKIKVLVENGTDVKCAISMRPPRIVSAVVIFDRNRGDGPQSAKCGPTNRNGERRSWWWLGRSLDSCGLL